ncbi:MAG: hypothetical protein KF715_09710 [Candidatus Didemnitutus sp.]|nr:hypothetical protein [Candidatus Didemnitutus sp.]
MELTSGSAKKVSTGMGFTGSMDSAVKAAAHSKKATAPLRTIAFIIGSSGAVVLGGGNSLLAKRCALFPKNAPMPRVAHAQSME